MARRVLTPDRVRKSVSGQAFFRYARPVEVPDGSVCALGQGVGFGHADLAVLFPLEYGDLRRFELSGKRADSQIGSFTCPPKDRWMQFDIRCPRRHSNRVYRPCGIAWQAPP